MNNVRFTCTSLVNGKKGIITPDEHGYYDMVIGGMNILNSAGQYYTYEGAKQLFEDSSAFMRRVKRGALRGEVGHPKPLPGQSYDEYATRIITIDERNVCVHFAEVYLNFKDFKNDDGTPIVAIMGKLAPSGPMGGMLKTALENPKENVCFSIRSFTEDYWNKGVKCRDLRTIVTFDYVNEPGIHIAEKFKNPGLEVLSERVFTKSQMERAIDRQTVSMGMESAVLTKQELFASFGWKQSDKPAYMKW